jgi:hypothetical protein
MLSPDTAPVPCALLNTDGPSNDMDTNMEEVIARCSPLAKDYVTLALRNKALQKEVLRRLSKTTGEIHAYDVEEIVGAIVNERMQNTD